MARQVCSSTDDAVTAQVLSEDVRRLLASAIASVPHLEAVLLLRDGSTPMPRLWSVTDVASRLYLPEARIHNILGELSDSGLLSQSGGSPSLYAYSPRTAELADVVNRLADAYRTHLIQVTEFIHSKTGRKAQHFADAFRWRKE